MSARNDHLSSLTNGNRTGVNATMDDASSVINYEGFTSTDSTQSSIQAISAGTFYQNTVSYTSSAGASASFSFQGESLPSVMHFLSTLIQIQVPRCTSLVRLVPPSVPSRSNWMEIKSALLTRAQPSTRTILSSSSHRTSKLWLNTLLC